MNLESIRELGKKAIPGEFPAGRDVRELEGFLALQAEIDRSQSISASGAVDWKKVQKLSEELLDREGKDLLVACYLSVALTRTGGPPGFLAGLKVMADLVEDYWETLFPPLKRLRGRRNAISWWLEQQKEILPKLDNPPLSPREMADGREVARRLNRTLGDKDPEGPLLSPVIALLDALPVLEPEPLQEIKEAVPPESSAPSPEPLEPVSRQEEPIAIPEEEPEDTLERIYAAMKIVSENLLAGDPTDFRIYRTSRMSLWDQISVLPDSQDRVTRIPPPPHPLQSALESVLASGSPEDLIAFSETQQPVYPFWLDLSFHEAMALEKMGESGQQAALALKGEISFLLKRLAGIESLSFSDNTPFLSPEGKKWLESLHMGDQPPGGGETLASSALFEPVRLMIGDGRHEEAARRFEEIRKKAPSARIRLHLDTEFLMEIAGRGRDFPVETFALSLLRESDRIDLDLWEPELSKRVLPLLYRIFSQSEEDDLQKEAGRLMRRLVALDISSAIVTFQKR
jgi:type VI secretion system protein VasJ